MLRLFMTCLLALQAAVALANEPVAPPMPEVRQLTRVVVIPVRDQIAKPVLYIIRRGLKEAIEQKADVVVLDMKTPGGALDVTFDIMEALAKFPGETITFVNTEAISAGAFISAVTDQIYFAPDGIIGAAAPVTSTGADVDKTMKLKIVSYLKARVRAISEDKPYRGKVISAMIDEDYELKIDDTVIKEKGELLSLTATEASKTYGDPPQPLLAAGIAKDVGALLAGKFGPEGYSVTNLEVTWSEDLAVLLNAISPVLLGLGLLGLFIEFKTPGFGVFGVGGGLLLAVVFLGNYVAGFSGHEPMLIFALGLILVAVEIFFLPGTVIMALGGVVLMLGSLLWSMADIWPNEPVTISADIFLQPVLNLTLGMLLALVGGVILIRFLPKGMFWDKMVLVAATTGKISSIPADREASLIGRTGVAVTDMFPSGQIEIDGQRYEARVNVGMISSGQKIVVRARREFGLQVEAVTEEEPA